MDSNQNIIVTDRWSNPVSHQRYSSQWPDEPACQKQHEEGRQCGGCSFFSKFNADWGLCCHSQSRHHLETVFEHFTCPSYIDEGWGPHSFTDDESFHCRCHGEDHEYWDQLVTMLKPSDKSTT